MSLTEAVTGRSHGDEPAANYTLPLIEVRLCQFRMSFYSLDLLVLFFQGLELTFPIEDSLLTCYKGRQSCVDNDLPSEVRVSHDYRWFERMIMNSTLNPG